MDADQEAWTPEEREFYRRAMTEGTPATRRRRLLVRFQRAIPSDPRCHACYGPFAGIGGKLLGLTGFAPSRKNPRFCNT